MPCFLQIQLSIDCKDRQALLAAAKELGWTQLDEQTFVTSDGAALRWNGQKLTGDVPERFRQIYGLNQTEIKARMKGYRTQRTVDQKTGAVQLVLQRN